MFDIPVLFMIALAALGVISKNAPVAIAMLILVLLRITNVKQMFPYLEKHAVTLGIIVQTIGVMAPIASGRVGIQDILRTFTQLQSLLAVAVGAGVAYLGGRGVQLMSAQPFDRHGIADWHDSRGSLVSRCTCRTAYCCGDCRSNDRF